MSVDGEGGGGRTIYTIGHSNHGLEDFLRLLAARGVEVLVDVRSKPYSRYVPHFNQGALRDFLEKHGIDCRHMGDRLGGMPQERSMYDEEGRVLYRELARSEGFRQGIGELISLASELLVAVMCSEEDPSACHRSLLVGRVLAREGIEVVHIRGDGRLESSVASGGEAPGGQTEMFPAKEEEWKSTRSVLPVNRRRDSFER